MNKEIFKFIEDNLPALCGEIYTFRETGNAEVMSLVRDVVRMIDLDIPKSQKKDIVIGTVMMMALQRVSGK